MKNWNRTFDERRGTKVTLPARLTPWEQGAPLSRWAASPSTPLEDKIITRPWSKQINFSLVFLAFIIKLPCVF